MIVIVVILVLICLGCCLALKREHALLCKARKSDKMKTAFIKGLSREIRTHLHSVSGLAEIISKEDLYLSKSEKRNISTQIKYNTSLVSTLLDEVTVFSDEKGGHPIQDDRFSPNILCQHCLDANLSLTHEGVRMILRSQLDSNYFVSADHHIVELVMNKLVQCACHFTEKGEIIIGCRLGDPSHLLQFYVEDTGGGIPPERAHVLFKWFEDPDEMAEPTEFDLSVAQRLAAKVGGFLRWDEQYQKGTRMVFTLPVR